MKSSKGLCAALMLYGCIAHAAEPVGDLRLNGFVTQGYFLSDHNSLYGDSEAGSFDFREVGVNGFWYFRPELRAAAQLMSRRAGEVDDGKLRFDYLQLDWRLLDTPRHQHGIRLGRLKIPYGLYNDTRDVAFTRPSILLPQEIYFDSLRDLALSLDGVGYYEQFGAGDYNLDLNLLAGRARSDASVQKVLSGGVSGHFDGGDAYVGSLMVADQGERWRLGLSLASVALDYDAQGAATAPLFLEDGEYRIDFTVVSAQYNLERWTLSAEYMRQRQDWDELGGALTLLPDTDYEAYYLQAQYRFRPRWDLVLRYGEGYSDRHDRDGQAYRATVMDAFGIDVPAHARYAKDLTLGLGWQPSPAWLLRAELHRVKGTLWLAAPDNPDPGQLEKSWHLFALQASYRF